MSIWLPQIKVKAILYEMRSLNFIKSKVEEHNCIHKYNKHDYIHPLMDFMGEPTKSYDDRLLGTGEDKYHHESYKNRDNKVL